MTPAPLPDSTAWSPPTMLCVRSRAADPVLHQVLQRYDATVVHDGRLALRKGRFGSYDIFLAYDPRSARAPIALWEHMRAMDINTPFAIVCASDVPSGFEERLRPGYDALVRHPCSVGDLVVALQRLLQAAERRSLHARSAELRAVSDEIQTRLEHLERRARLSRESVRRAQEHVVRAIAMREFAAGGGTRAHFERDWPDVFESVLSISRRESIGQPGSEERS